MKLTDYVILFLVDLTLLFCICILANLNTLNGATHHTFSECIRNAMQMNQSGGDEPTPYNMMQHTI